MCTTPDPAKSMAPELRKGVGLKAESQPSYSEMKGGKPMTRNTVG